MVHKVKENAPCKNSSESLNRIIGGFFFLHMYEEGVIMDKHIHWHILLVILHVCVRVHTFYMLNWLVCNEKYKNKSPKMYKTFIIKI